MSALSGFTRSFWLRRLNAAWIALALVRPAAAAEPEVALDCAQLTREQAAEVEARARATLLTSTVAVTRVLVSCAESEARVVVESGSAQATEQVPLLTPDIRTPLVDAVDRAIQVLASRARAAAALPPEPAPPASAEPPVQALVPTPAPAVKPRAQAATVAPSPRAQGPARSLRASASALAEVWTNGGGLGGALAVGYGTRQLQLGVQITAITSPSSSDAFHASEYGAALGVGWVPGWARGFRGGLALGPSLLAVSPRSDLTPRGDTSVAAWFVELGLARPFWFGNWALTPELSARLFSGQREVTLDEQTQLIIPYFVPRLALTLAYAFE